MLAATAADADGTIAKVEFFAGATLIATSTVAPYAATWTSVPAGSYSVFARATDNFGAATSSASVTVTVLANQLPTVSITSPTSGATFNAPTDITINANAADSDGSVAKVEFFAGAVLIGTSTTAPYSVIWANAPLGTHNLTAKSTDNQGAAATTSGRSVTVNGTTIALSGPVNNAVLQAPAQLTLQANATTSGGNITKIEFFDGATLLNSFTTTGTSVSGSLNLTGILAGVHVYTAKATTDLGGTATSAPLNVNVVAAPTVSLAAPTSNAFYVAPALIRLSANAVLTSGSIAKVEFFAGGSTLIGSVTTAPYDTLWINVAANTYSITAKVTDSYGFTTTSAPVSINVASAPGVSVDGGIDGSTVNEDTVLITGTVQTPANSAVAVNGQLATLTAGGQFFVNNVVLQPGVNVLSVSVVTQDEQSNVQTLTVNHTGVVAPFAVTVDADEGFAPLTTTFTVTNPADTPFDRIEFDFNGDGIADYTARTLDEAAVPFTVSAGVTTFTLRFKDAAGTVLYTTTKKVYAFDPLLRYQLVKGVYLDLVERLKLGNIPVAMNTVTGSADEIYRPIFTALGSTLATAAAQLGQIASASVSGESAQIFVVRDGPEGKEGYFIHLIRGADGIWRIDSM